jgi:type III secretion protein J
MMRFLFLIFATLFLTGCSERVAIINGVDEREANEIVVFLASKGIAADKTPMAVSAAGGGSAQPQWNIFVESSKITEALAILNRNGLPRKQGQNLLEIFGESGLVPTDLQQKIRYQAGLAEQIANTIRQIDGVIDATVQISIPTDEEQTITAAVYVKHQGVLDNPNSQLVVKIKQLVAGSVPGLKLENVTVISDRSRFTDINLAPPDSVLLEEEKYFVTIWGMMIAKSSVGLFRFVFLLLCAFVLLLIGLLLFTLYKALPYIHEKGGLASFYIPPKPKVEKKEEEKEEPSPDEEKQDSEEEVDESENSDK